MPRRFLFATAGGFLAAGAPLGLLAVRLALGDRRGRVSMRDVKAEIEDHRPDYIYVGASTAIAFTLFGFVVGRHADRLAELSETDPLTGLCNARRLFDGLEAALARARRSGEPLALLLVDLDGLKPINDQFGHQAGDAAIRGLADVIRSELRRTDIGARWGGDEFAVLAPATSQAAALAVAERIRAMVQSASVPFVMSASVGVAVVDPRQDSEEVDAATLMRAADAALYEAKRRGRNRVVSASPRQLTGHGDIWEPLPLPATRPTDHAGEP